MMDRVGKVSSYFARRIHYGDKNPEYQEFLDQHNFPQAEMFQKKMEYAWQKEFRIILSKQDSTDPKMIYIGSIEDIAISGDIEELREGLLIADEADPITSAVSIIKHNVGWFNVQLQIPPIRSVLRALYGSSHGGGEDFTYWSGGMYS